MREWSRRQQAWIFVTSEHRQLNLSQNPAEVPRPLNRQGKWMGEFLPPAFIKTFRYTLLFSQPSIYISFFSLLFILAKGLCCGKQSKPGIREAILYILLCRTSIVILKLIVRMCGLPPLVILPSVPKRSSHFREIKLDR